MMFEFQSVGGKRPEPEDVPTRISVGGREYDVKDYCVDAPARHEGDLLLHGFKPRQRDKVEVRKVETKAETKAEKA